MVNAKYKDTYIRDIEHEPFKVTRLQEANLRKLALFLYDLTQKKLDEEHLKFNMLYFSRISQWYDGPRPHEITYQCGTVACAAGYGPKAGIKVTTPMGWMQYVEESFGADPWGILYHWVFAGFWHDADNTPRGAAQRIFYVLRHREVPKIVIRDMHHDLNLTPTLALARQAMSIYQKIRKPRS